MKKIHKIAQSERREKPTMLFSAPYEFFPSDLKNYLKDHYNITFAFNAPYEKVKTLLKDTEIWITGTCPPYYMDKNLISSGSRLKIMATPSTGTNHIDVQYAEKCGIKILSLKNSPVIEKIYASSEFSFALLLAMVKKIPFATNAARKGIWREKEHEFRNIELNGKTIGLIGYGRIGKKMARFCHSFDMNILAFDPYKKIKEKYVNQTSSLNNLLMKADIVSLHYHLTPKNHQSFNNKHFTKMKKGAYFLNTARGELVDEKAMIKALKTEKLKAAAVDVISNEHLKDKKNHPVIKYAQTNDNLIVSPHIAGCTIDSESKAAWDILKQIKENTK